jgi:type IV pilus assembly protein PilY1
MENSPSPAARRECGAGTFNTCKKKENVVYVGANDGMLHAFKTGILDNSGLDASSHEVEKLTGIPTSDMGKELWAFIPKNSLPYLRCLAIPPPNSCHLYYSDLSPYIANG